MNPHQGTDIACPIGTPVKAAADGIVTLAGGPYFYSGNMVVLEHGHNLSTIYAHLDKVNVKAGDKVKQGDVIALSGKPDVSPAPISTGEPRSTASVFGRIRCLNRVIKILFDL